MEDIWVKLYDRDGPLGHNRPVLMYVGVVELLRDLPLYGGRFDSPLIRDLESRRDDLTRQSTGWALVYATSRRSLRLLCGEYGQIECKKLYASWRRNHGERSMYRRDDEKLQCRDGDQAGHFSASQGAEPAGFSAQNSSAEVKDSCS